MAEQVNEKLELGKVEVRPPEEEVTMIEKNKVESEIA